MTFRIEPEVIIGAGVLGGIGAAAVSIGNKALVFSGQGEAEERLLRRVSGLLEDAGISVISSDAAPLLAAADVAETLGDLARGSRAGMIIALGRPQVQAIARVACATALSRLSAPEFIDGAVPHGSVIPLISVPVSASDPFILAQNFVVTDPRDRLVRLVKTPAGICRALILDSEVLEAPHSDHPLAESFAGFLAAFEGWCSRRASAISDPLLERAAAAFASRWPLPADRPAGDEPPPPDPDAAAKLAAAERAADPFALNEEDYGKLPDFGGASEAGGADYRAEAGDLSGVEAAEAEAAGLLALGAAISPPALGTALAWAVSGRFPVDRALVSAAILPHIAERLAQTRPEKAARAALLAGVEGTDTPDLAAKLPGRIREALASAGVPSRLRDAGLDLDRMAPAVEAARNLECVFDTPWTVTGEDALALLKAAY